MLYIKVLCDHNEDDQPVLYLNELDDDNFEIRKIMIYRNGKVVKVSEDTETDDAFLSCKEFSTLDEINEYDEVTASEISKEEFERSGTI